MIKWKDNSLRYSCHPDFFPNQFVAELPGGHTALLERTPDKATIWRLSGLGAKQRFPAAKDYHEAQDQAVLFLVERAKTIASRMQEIVKAISWESTELLVPLPDGRCLAAYDKRNPEYPGLKIEIRDAPDGEGNTIAWVEYNQGREDYSDRQRLRMLLWKKEYHEDESDEPPAVNMGYELGDFESP